MAARKKCNRGKVIFDTELDAKIALATRMRKDKGEVRHYPCTIAGHTHWHLTSEEEKRRTKQGVGLK